MIVSLFQICHCPTVADKCQHCQLPCDGRPYTIKFEQTNPRTPPRHPNSKISTTNSPSYVSHQKIQHRQNSTTCFFVSHVPSCSADTLGRFLGFCFCGHVRFTSNKVKEPCGLMKLRNMEWYHHLILYFHGNWNVNTNLWNILSAWT